jgi:hypothetical protein
MPVHPRSHEPYQRHSTTQIDLRDALKQQQAQLRRLLNAKIWISNAPKATREEMNAQVAQIKSLIQELEEAIRVTTG